MISMEQKVAVKPDIVSRQVQNEEVILDLLTGTYFGLNEVGTRMWELLQKKSSLGMVAKKIAAEYDVGEAEAEADLLKLVQNLKKRELIELV